MKQRATKLNLLISGFSCWLCIIHCNLSQTESSH